MKQKGTKKREYLRSVSYTNVETGAKYSTITQLYKIGLYVAEYINGKYFSQGNRQNPPITNATNKAIKELEKQVTDGVIKDLHYTVETAWKVDGFWEKYEEPFEVPSDYTYYLNVHFYDKVAPVKAKHAFAMYKHDFFLNNTRFESFGVCEWSTGANIVQGYPDADIAILEAKKKLKSYGKKKTEEGINRFKYHALTKINKPYEK